MGGYRSAGHRLGGLYAPNSGKGPKTYGAGRVCRVSGCETLLSAYNPSPVCSLHGAWLPVVVTPTAASAGTSD